MSLTSKAEWKSGVGIAGSGTTLTWTDQIAGYVLQRTFGTPSYASGVVSLPAGAGMRMPTSPLMSTSGTPLIIGVRLKVVTFTQYMRLFYLGNGSTYNDANYVGISLDQASSTSWTVSFGPVTRTVSSYVGSTINVIQVLNGSSSQLYFGTTQQGANYNNIATSMGNRFQLKDLADLNYASVGSVDYTCARIATATSIAADVAEMNTWLTAGGNSSDLSIALTGLSSTSGIGTLLADHSSSLAGVSSTGQIGTLVLARSLGITGFTSSGDVGVLVPSSSIPASGVQGTGQINNLILPTISVPTLGNEATGNVGSVQANRDIPVTGQAATGNIGVLIYSSSFGMSGVQGNGQQGNIGDSLTIPLIGIEGLGQIGTLTVDFSNNVTVNLTGLSATGNFGTILASIESTLQGLSSIAEIGSLNSTIDVVMVGIEAVGAIGTLGVQITNNVTVQLTGLQATGQIGTLGSTGGTPSTPQIVGGVTIYDGVSAYRFVVQVN